MRTLIQVQNANCTYCIGAVREELLARPRVHHVEMSLTAGCLEVDHDHDDPAALVELLRQSLHGAQVADNGEVVMIMTDPELTQECSLHPSDQKRHP
jgi:copper chaperone CopZ